MTQSIVLLELERDRLQNELKYTYRRLAKNALHRKKLEENVENCLNQITELNKNINVLKKAQSID